MLRTISIACGGPVDVRQESLHPGVPETPMSNLGRGDSEGSAETAENLELFELSERLSYIGVPRTIGDDGSFRSNAGVIQDNPETECLLLLSQHLFAKYNDTDAVSNAQAFAAVSKLFKSEERNAETNRKFSVTWKYHQDWHAHLAYAKSELARLLRPEGITTGEINPSACDQTIAQWLRLEVGPSHGFGPGSSTRLSRKRGDASYKYSGKPHVTSNAALYAMDARSAVQSWMPVVLRKQFPYMLRDRKIKQISTLFEQVKGDVLDVVPKNRLSGRMIGKQPDMNLYVQKGLGAFMRRRLKRVGIDLDHQSNNADGALEASLTGLMSTIDLSDASNSNALGVCRTLFPEDVMDYIMMSRVAYGTLPEGLVKGPDGDDLARTFKYEMVSAMGNGFTFELMTCIIWALARSVVHFSKARDKRILVYGDDIIVSNQDGVTETLIKLMRYCGYLINDEKSFVDGPYRESCGTHAVAGSVITPFYIRRPVNTSAELRLLHNNLWRWRHRCQNLLDAYQISEIEKTLAWIRGHDNTEHLFIPDGFGDGAYTGYLSDLVVRRHKGQWECYTFKHYTTGNQSVVHEEDGLLCKSLLGLESKTLEIGFVGINLPVDAARIHQTDRKVGTRKQRSMAKGNSSRDVSLDEIYPSLKADEKSVKQQLLIPCHKVATGDAWWLALEADSFIFDFEQRLDRQLCAELLAVRHTLINGPLA